MASSSAREVPREDIESLVGQSVEDLSLYRQALTHRSLLRGEPEQHIESNERLEFLGDALIDLVVGDVLYRRFPKKDEGYLTRLRARLVNGPALARCARRMDLGAHLLMSKNAEKGEGRDNPNLLADAFEALAGALYFDQGYAAAAQFVRERSVDLLDLDDVDALDQNYKSRLLEHVQAEEQIQPTYRVVREQGPSHDKTFTVEAMVGDTAYARGTADSKQQAEQEAARRTLASLRSSESTG